MERTVKNYREMVISMINAMVRPVALNAWVYQNMEAAKRYYTALLLISRVVLKLIRKRAFSRCFTTITAQ